MPLFDILLIFATGIVAGIINTMAAGGSLLTLPMLIFLGLPSSVANGTNRIAIIVQTITASTNFYRKGVFDKKLAILLGIPAIAGALLGANLAITISDKLFNQILAVMMVVAVIFIVWKPKKATLENIQSQKYSVKKQILGAVIFFLIGIYGGFIQAGAGFFIIAAATAMFGVSLVRANSLKVLISGMYVFVSIFIFIYHGEIDWVLGLSLAAGNAIGAWIGSNLAVNKGDRWIRIFLMIAVIGMAVKLIFS